MRLLQAAFCRVLLGVIALGVLTWVRAADHPPARQPNIILIFVDDLGYGDLGCFGSKNIRTPRLDRMAMDGIKLTSFYDGAPLCGPSRAALMTGCYPQRPEIVDTDGHRHFHLIISNEEITMAEVLNAAGYRTMAIGKWHLAGSGGQAVGWKKEPAGLEQFYAKNPRLMPTAQGFDHYYGIPYSNDMQPLVVMRDDKFVEYPVDLDGITTRYTNEAIKFISENRDHPFFLYLAHNMPHTPLHPSPGFAGKSADGPYGDCVEEIDYNVGRILDLLKELDLDRNTLVVFTSDNGPWIDRPNGRTPETRDPARQSGTAGPLRGMKMTTWEGGPRVPFVAMFPGVIPAGRVSNEVVTTMDLYPTFARLADEPLPRNRVIDGRDALPLLSGATDRGPHDVYYYYKHDHLLAVRDDRYKLALPREAKLPDLGYYGHLTEGLDKPQLYDLTADIGETTDISADHPDVVAHLERLAAAARQDLGDPEHIGKGQRGDYRWKTRYGPLKK